MAPDRLSFCIVPLTLKQRANISQLKSSTSSRTAVVVSITAISLCSCALVLCLAISKSRYKRRAFLPGWSAATNSLTVRSEQARWTDQRLHKAADVSLCRVKDVLSYLQLADNPAYTAALTRVINVPKRGVGDKTVMQIVSAARLKNVSPFEICVKIANGGAPITVTATQRKGIRQFVSVIRDLRQLAEEVN